MIEIKKSNRPVYSLKNGETFNTVTELQVNVLTKIITDHTDQDEGQGKPIASPLTAPQVEDVCRALISDSEDVVRVLRLRERKPRTKKKTTTTPETGTTTTPRTRKSKTPVPATVPARPPAGPIRHEAAIGASNPDGTTSHSVRD